MDTNKPKMTTQGCWVRIDAEHTETVEKDGLLSPGLFKPGFTKTPCGGFLETNIQSGYPARAESLGYTFAGNE